MPTIILEGRKVQITPMQAKLIQIRQMSLARLGKQKVRELHQEHMIPRGHRGSTASGTESGHYTAPKHERSAVATYRESKLDHLNKAFEEKVLNVKA